MSEMMAVTWLSVVAWGAWYGAGVGLVLATMSLAQRQGE